MCSITPLSRAALFGVRSGGSRRYRKIGLAITPAHIPDQNRAQGGSNRRQSQRPEEDISHAPLPVARLRFLGVNQIRPVVAIPMARHIRGLVHAEHGDHVEVHAGFHSRRSEVKGSVVITRNRGFALVMQPGARIARRDAFGEGDGARHLGDWHCVRAADRLPLERRDVVIGGGDALEGHRDVEPHAVHASDGGDVPAYLDDWPRRGIPRRGAHRLDVPMPGVRGIPGRVDVRAGPHGVDLGIRLAGGGIAHADIGDIEKLLGIEVVALVELPPLLIVAALAQMDVNVLGDPQVAVAHDLDLIVQAVVPDFRRLPAP